MNSSGWFSLNNWLFLSCCFRISYPLFKSSTFIRPGLCKVHLQIGGTAKAPKHVSQIWKKSQVLLNPPWWWWKIGFCKVCRNFLFLTMAKFNLKNKMMINLKFGVSIFETALFVGGYLQASPLTQSLEFATSHTEVIPPMRLVHLSHQQLLPWSRGARGARVTWLLIRFSLSTFPGRYSVKMLSEDEFIHNLRDLPWSNMKQLEDEILNFWTMEDQATAQHPAGPRMSCASWQRKKSYRTGTCHRSSELEKKRVSLTF